jgi:hypothetical protein
MKRRAVPEFLSYEVEEVEADKTNQCGRDSFLVVE